MSDHYIHIAKRFHDVYETLAPNYGYSTRDDTKEFDPKSPNGRLMRDVCREIIEPYEREIERLQSADICHACGSQSGVYLQICDDCMTKFNQLKADNEALRNGVPIGPIVGEQTIIEQDAEIKRLRNRISELHGHLDWIDWSTDGIEQRHKEWTESFQKIEQLQTELNKLAANVHEGYMDGKALVYLEIEQLRKENKELHELLEVEEPQPEYCDCPGYHTGACRDRYVKRLEAENDLLHEQLMQYIQKDGE